ncbi:Internalin-A [Diplonema papillatum]|nr:Internalin-A [Diplonema papillatum]
MALTHDLVKGALSNLGPTTNGTSLAYLNCDLTNLNLSNITLLEGFSELQRVDLSGNLLEDLAGLGKLKSLRTLIAKRNRLRAPYAALPHVFALQHVDLSANQLKSMPDLAPHKYLQVLKLDGNQIRSIVPLAGLRSLIELHLNDNCVADASGLEGAPIRRLYLSGNEIADTAWVEGLKDTLEELVMNSNEVTRFKAVDGLSRLTRLEVGGNRISDTNELTKLSKLHHLRTLVADDNPCFNVDDQRDCRSDGDSESDIVVEDNVALPPPVKSPVPDQDEAVPRDTLQRLKVIYMIPQLTTLNAEPVTYREKIKAFNILGEADVEERSSNEVKFLKQAVTRVGYASA